MSSRVGTAIPASRSTARSSSIVGFNRSIQTALSGRAAGSAAGSFFREDSEGTNTENMGNSGTGRQSHVLTRFLGAGRFLLRPKTPLSTSGTNPDSGKRFMTGALTASPYLWRCGGVYGGAVASARPRFVLGIASAQKTTGTRKICGIKATAGVPQRRTGVQMLAYQRVFADTRINGIVAFLAQHCCRERQTFDWKCAHVVVESTLGVVRRRSC